MVKDFSSMLGQEGLKVEIFFKNRIRAELLVDRDAIAVIATVAFNDKCQNVPCKRYSSIFR